MKGFYKQLTAILKNHGFVFERQGKGSHEFWCKGSLCVTVPSNCKSKFTANAILKQANISEKI
ncbi:type II toxin-antitoxin system HicA family toxin [Polynucleobacter alcilacus]|uniref:type II toxin-antitoxin system HicA family toxin n=1 Tax=Polynucleobacter alcilacus TaxID=1819739 RepID=UPI0034E19577|nr:type II toxin-antitoxin system HicA family toxin [Polynucleobacter alcilacus]